MPVLILSATERSGLKALTPWLKPGATVALLAFMAFSACASGAYLMNDLLDLAAHPQHEGGLRVANELGHQVHPLHLMVFGGGREAGGDPRGQRLNP